MRITFAWVNIAFIITTKNNMKKSKVINNVVMVTREFGNEIYIAPLKNLKIQITNKKEHAENWSKEYDQSKLDYYIIATGYKGLIFEKI